MLIPDGKAEGNGIVMKPNLTTELAQFRLNLIHRIIEINDNQKCAYMRLVEKFINKILDAMKEPGEIDLKKLWEKTQSENPMNIDVKLDFAAMIPVVQISSGNNLGLKVAQCQGVGKVIKLTDPDHPDNVKNR